MLLKEEDISHNSIPVQITDAVESDVDTQADEANAVETAETKDVESNDYWK